MSEVELGKSSVESLSPDDSQGRVSQYLEREVDGVRTRETTEIEMRIAAEVKRLRAEGKYPPSLLARAKSYYARFLPPESTVSATNFDQLLETLDSIAYMDVDVPLASKRPLVGPAKRLLRSAMAWYLNYLAQQFNNFANHLVRVVGVLDTRVSHLEESQIRTLDDVAHLIIETVSLRVEEGVISAVDVLGEDLEGRVLVAECGKGVVLSGLVSMGTDAYGVDTRATFLDICERERLDVRNDTVLGHLKKVGTSALGGLVLFGIVDRAENTTKFAVLSEAARVVAPGGKLVIASASAELFAKAIPERDISPGHPWAPETWTRLLELSGWENCQTTSLGSVGYAITCRASNSVADIFDIL